MKRRRRELPVWNFNCEPDYKLVAFRFISFQPHNNLYSPYLSGTSGDSRMQYFQCQIQEDVLNIHEVNSIS